MSKVGWSDDLMKNWMDSQQRYWNAWSDMAQSSMGNQNSGLNMPPWSQGLEQWWQTMMPQAPAEQTDVMQRVVDMGKMYMSMAEKAFSAAQPQEKNNTNPLELWMSAMEQGFQTWSKQLSMGQVPSGDFGLGQMSLEGWNKALKSMGMGQFANMQMPNFQMPDFNQFQTQFQNPFQAFQNTQNPFQAFQNTQNPFQAFQNMQNPFQNFSMPNHPQGWEEQMRKALNTPGVGYSRESQEAWQEIGTLMLNYQEAMRDYLQAFAKQGTQSIDALRERVSSLSSEGKQVESLRELYDLWVDVNEDVYAAFAMSDEYQVVYGDMVNAFMALKEGMNKQMEQFYRSMNVPTRTEINSAYQKQQQLKRENRALKKELKDLAKRVAALEASEKPAAPKADVASVVEQVAEPVKTMFEQQAEVVKQAADAMDDLTQIKGVGPVISQKLYDMGINSFTQLSEIASDQLNELDKAFGDQGRVMREDWIGQARNILDSMNKK